MYTFLNFDHFLMFLKNKYVFLFHRIKGIYIKSSCFKFQEFQSIISKFKGLYMVKGISDNFDSLFQHFSIF